jgi:hypothetical protein
MSKRQLTSILVLSLFFIFLSTGCAHKPVVPSQSVSENLQEDQKRKITTGETEQIPPDSEMEDKSDEDFFEKEFEEDKVQVADPLSPGTGPCFISMINFTSGRLNLWPEDIRPLLRILSEPV